MIYLMIKALYILLAPSYIKKLPSNNLKPCCKASSFAHNEHLCEDKKGTLRGTNNLGNLNNIWIQRLGQKWGQQYKND